jgi:RHS repeat-associated protein
MTFNSAGQPLTVKDALNNQTQFGYLAGDLKSITDPLNRTTNRFTDALGRLVSITDPAGEFTELTYNPLNQVLTTANPIGGVTSFTYDGNGNLLTVKDANNHTTSYTYENMDRLATRTDALNRSESYQYDANGNLTQFTDRRGKVTTYVYDNLNRRTFAGFGTQAGPTYESTINYTWDGGNRLTQIVDSVTGTITRGYDGLDRLTSEQTPQGTVSYTYDAAGRRQTMTVAGQTAVNYTFDNANRLTNIAQGTTTIQLGYDSSNRRTSLTLANGIVVSYGYDNASELTALTYTLNSNTLGSLTYGYDIAGRRTTLGGTYARTGLPSAQATTGYDAANELTTWGAATPTYDSNGNVLSDGTNSYVWNARNQLVSMNMSAESFQYDPLGRRVTKTILGTTTNYLYDGLSPTQELSGTTPTANLLTGAVDEYFQRTDSSGPANFLADALGNTIAVTNSSGTNIAQYTYEPFGNTTITGSSNSTYQYTGRENDGTGVYFYRARYYNQTTQRFVSEDPIDFEDGTNKYQYVANSPPNFTDPRGLQTTQTGVGGTFTAAPLALTGGGGVATDEFGDVGLYLYGGGGAGFGAGFSGGLQGSLSNGNTINDLSGSFYNTSIGGGDGIGGSYDGFSGTSPSGNQVAGLGGTVGPAAGFSGFAGRTNTWVFPLFNWIQWLAGRQCPNGAPSFMYQPAGGGLYYTPEPGEPGFPWN